MSDLTASVDNKMPAETTDIGYRVLARRYRPSSFETLIGQAPMVRTLENAFATGRIAQAYMLTGVRGVGKTTTARILARALNYKSQTIDKPTLDLSIPGENCEAIMAGNHVDVVELDAASHTGIGDVREIISSMRYSPVSARYKVYIIDEVHMLSTAAFNGLLKTLEEPPEHVKFIFATTEIRKVPITVLSRCQRFDLRRIESGDLAAFLAGLLEKEGVKADGAALAMIARAAEGSVRDALSLLDQAISHSASKDGGEIVAGEVRDMLGLADRSRVIDLFEMLMKGELAAALQEFKSQYDSGAEPVRVLTDLAEFVHFVTRLRYIPDALNDPALTPDEKERGKAFSDALSPRILGRTWQMLLKGIEEVRSTERAMAATDMVLVRIAHAAELPSPEDLVRQLQDGNAGGAATSAGEPTSSPSGGAATGQSSGPVAARKGGGIVADLVAEPQRQAEPLHAVAPVISSFQDLLKLAEEKRDIRFKLMLRNNVSLVRFERGHIELKPVGDAPRDMLNQISARMKEWTGENWLIVASEVDGEATLREREEAEREALVADAEQDPVVAAVLHTFPNSRIVDIRVSSEEAGLIDADIEELSASPEDDGLDEYFNS